MNRPTKNHHTILAVLSGYLIMTFLLFTPPLFAQSNNLHDIDNTIQQAEQLIRYNQDLDEADDLLGSAEIALMETAQELELNASSSIIRSRMIRIGQARAALQEQLLIRAAENEPASPQVPLRRSRAGRAESAPAETEAATETAEPAEETPAEEAAELPANDDYQNQLDTVNSLLRQAYTAIYGRDELEKGQSLLDEADIKLSELETNPGANTVPGDLERSRSRLAEYREELEKRQARIDAQAAEAAAEQERIAAEQAEEAERLSEAETVFLQWADSIEDLHELNKTIANYQRDEEVAEIMPRANRIFSQTEQLIQDMETVFPESEDIRTFMESNQRAQEMNLRALLGDMQSLLEQAQGRLDAYASGLLNQAESELVSMEYYDRLDLVAAAVQLIRRNTEIAKAVKPEDASLALDANEILREAENTYRTAQRRISEAEMAEDVYEGEDGDELRQEIATIYSDHYPDDVVAVVVTSENWEERIVAESTNDNTITANSYMYISAQVAVRKSSGLFVFPLSLRRSWTGTGDEYGPIELRSIGVQFSLPEENLP